VIAESRRRRAALNGRGDAEVAVTSETIATGESPGSRLTPRGKKTFDSLIHCARIIFERDGFLKARIADIAELAGVSHGTFYTYFPSKEEIFYEVVRDLSEEFYREAYGEIPTSGTAIEKIAAANRRYLSIYRRNAAMMAVIEQVATFNDEFRVHRREIRIQFVRHTETAINRLLPRSLSAMGFDVHVASNALVSMIDRFAYLWFVLGEPFPDDAEHTLTLLWAGSIGVPILDESVSARS
jgi:AcrR family transcriptional regulator